MVAIDYVNGRSVCLKGIGKLFYQEGFPIPMAVAHLKSKGVEVSILHVADELLKHGWSEETVFRKLKYDLEDCIAGEEKFSDFETLRKFIWASYEDQREMIFQYLFGCNTDQVRSGENTYPLDWLKV